MGQVEGISHITFICQNIDKSSLLFQELFGAVEIYSSDAQNFSLSREKFLLLGNLWIALMEGAAVSPSYNHIAFKVTAKDLPGFESKIMSLGLKILPGRPRESQEGLSLYFYDYDNHLFELHTSDLESRLAFYLQKKTMNPE